MSIFVSDTAKNIQEELQDICEEFDIVEKVKYVITDNAANTKKTFTTVIPSDDDSPPTPVQNDDIWNETEESMMDVADLQVQIIGCYAHTLQLTVRHDLGLLDLSTPLQNLWYQRANNIFFTLLQCNYNSSIDDLKGFH